MEIVTKLPEGLSAAEVLPVAAAIPCVHRSYRDSKKYIEEPLLLQQQQQHYQHHHSPNHHQQQQQQQQEQQQQEGEGISNDDNSGAYRRLKRWGLSELSARVINAAAAAADPASSASSASASAAAATAANEEGDGEDSSIPPNDPIFSEQWSLQEGFAFGAHAEKAWHQWTGVKRPMVIAVIDSGCAMDHPDLISKRWNNEGEICGDGIDNDHNGLIDDCYGWDFVNNTGDLSADASGHGTGAAGVIAAAANNHLGVVGLCWGFVLLLLIQAIDYAVKMGAWISNNSYGGYG
ncbi:subtilase family serine protease, putative [Eimeria brunetti]|uniref:subtilisin n=1 Tax=Eimeria brunetti TaxID=51314 RepID=U6LHE9_9EIME|nr:subtilase family serine protease, putative [Eimeria brunetti]